MISSTLLRCQFCISSFCPLLFFNYNYLPSIINRRRLKDFVFVSSLYASSSFVNSTVGCSHRHPAFVMRCRDSLPSTTGVRRSARLSQKRSLHELKRASSTPEDPASIKPEKKGSSTSATYNENVRTRSRKLKPNKNKIPPRSENSLEEVEKSTKPKGTATESPRIVTPSTDDFDNTLSTYCLPRARELQLKASHADPKTSLAIIGVDEAGRGPLAGPVVAAAAICPTDIAGVVDSKKITKEVERERIYEKIVSSPGVKYAIAVISAQRIDEINILEATLEGMRMAVEAVVNYGEKGSNLSNNNEVSAERTDLTYVITGGNQGIVIISEKIPRVSYFALIDGNKVPKEMPCPSESLTKGDGREFCIGAASILAKVTRDRLMHGYCLKYPEYNLSQHKGYPTAAHMAAIRRSVRYVDCF